MTEGEKRRSQIIKILKDSKSPVSGTKLAKVLKVSRQVIVQDMRIFRVHHDTEHTLDELQLIVDYGGKVLDVFVEHPLYGQIRADLMIANRMEAKQFVEQMEAHAAHPLKLLTDDCHYHMISSY